MSNETPADSRSATDQILDLLLDALQERQKARRQRTGQIPASVEAERPVPAAAEGLKAAQQRSELQVTSTPAVGPAGAEVSHNEESQARAQPVVAEAETAPPVPPARPEPPRSEWSRPAYRPVPSDRSGPSRQSRELEPGDEGWEPPEPLPPIHMNKTMGRLFALVALLVVLFNIPVTRYGVSLARIMPESSSLIIRDGLVLKGSSPEIYMLENDRLRWISSLDAFEHLGLTWADVHVVEDSFLARFEQGRPIHVLLKCNASPHIYRLENNQKRWIKDIDTFLAEGHVWEDVRFVSCDYLRSIPDGLPIPEDAGPPPQP
jgi:hypothetical protein